ncbi:hypothetical protein [Chryseobacterium sp. G0201]|uniref:hypothetical protein n=1 Tax=Chryseobacterium sp. G0201 TaxID=2487065 RepID=UPI000F508CC8|nr:hypothetical protein [Chryseobacterium sp. G0201]
MIHLLEAQGSTVEYYNNGIKVTPIGSIQYGNCGYGANSTIARPAGGVWYNEIRIRTIGTNIEMICVSDVQ